MRAGDCWIIKFEHSGPKAHLWFLLVDPQPDGLAVIANVTTLRHNADRTVILQPGDHPLLRHPSFVLYSDCQIINVPDLQKWIETGIADPNDPFQHEVIKEIQRGAQRVVSTTLRQSGKKFTEYYRLVVVVC